MLSGKYNAGMDSSGSEESTPACHLQTQNHILLSATNRYLFQKFVNQVHQKSQDNDNSKDTQHPFPHNFKCLHDKLCIHTDFSFPLENACNNVQDNAAGNNRSNLAGNVGSCCLHDENIA